MFNNTSAFQGGCDLASLSPEKSSPNRWHSVLESKFRSHPIPSLWDRTVWVFCGGSCLIWDAIILLMKGLLDLVWHTGEPLANNCNILWIEKNQNPWFNAPWMLKCIVLKCNLNYQTFWANSVACFLTPLFSFSASPDDASGSFSPQCSR